jgi:uncharacterized protein with von Willebrand factor type A (vWA) domain
MKTFAMDPDDAEILTKNAKELGLSDSAFIKLCILIGSQELKLRDDYTFKYSYLRWYKPKDLIEDVKKTIEKEEKKVEKVERKVEREERKVEEKKVEQPQPKSKIKIQL